MFRLFRRHRTERIGFRQARSSLFIRAASDCRCDSPHICVALSVANH